MIAVEAASASPCVVVSECVILSTVAEVRGRGSLGMPSRAYASPNRRRFPDFPSIIACWSPLLVARCARPPRRPARSRGHPAGRRWRANRGPGSGPKMPQSGCRGRVAGTLVVAALVVGGTIAGCTIAGCTIAGRTMGERRQSIQVHQPGLQPVQQGGFEHSGMVWLDRRRLATADRGREHRHRGGSEPDTRPWSAAMASIHASSRPARRWSSREPGGSAAEFGWPTGAN